MDKLHKEVEKRIEITDMILDLLIQTGDSRALFAKKITEFYRTAGKLSTNKDITDEQFKELVNIIEQFNKMINDYLEKEGI